MSKKKTILIHSAGSKLKTGFSRHLKTLFSALYKTDKYRLIEYANQPYTFKDRRLKSLPWEAFGAMPESDEGLKPNLNELEKTMIGYGHLYLDKIIVDEKVDVYIGVEDIWGLSGLWKRPWFNKIHSILWSPCDSLPLIPLFKEAAASSKNFWVKAEFGNKALREIGINHAKTIPALIDDSPFFPLPEDERTNLRNQVGISEDTFVVGFVFRNQLRKLVGTLLDGLKLFKEQNPDAKVKVLLHTDWKEQQWPIQKLMEDIGISKEDILTTYICHACKNVQVTNYHGEELQCPACNKKALFTAGVVCGVTEPELNQIYNLCDLYSHPVTSGGFEMPVLEALYAGVPVATVPYACCETYTGHSDVYAFDCSYYREVGSTFLKAQPAPQSVADSISHFYSQSRSERKEAGLRLREWALEKFSAEKWIKWIENFIDNLPDVDYDYSINKLNTDFPFTPNEDNKTFLIELYKGVCNKDIDENNQELKVTIEALENGITQRQVYDDLLNSAQEANKQQNKPKLSDLLEDNGKKRVLFVMPNERTDCVASLPVIEKLFEVYKEYDFYLATELKHFEIFSHLNKIKTILPYEEWMDNSLALEGQGDKKGYFDICFHPYLMTRKFHSYSHNGLDIDQLQNG